MKSAGAGRMGVPTVPLTELYSAGAEYITKRGGTVRLRSSVDSISLQSGNVKIVSGAESFVSDYAVLAVPYHTLAKMLPPGETSEILGKDLAKFESSPITGIHLWFDREISDLEHAVLLDRTIQWMFHKSKLLDKHRENGNRAGTESSGSYVELVISSSKTLVDVPRGEIIELALK